MSALTEITQYARTCLTNMVVTWLRTENGPSNLPSQHFNARI
jgi:hypothetical protein